MKVVAYYRYSSEGAAQVANSVERQRISCQSWANTIDARIIEEVIDEATSGGLTKENLDQLAKRVEDGFSFDALMVDDQSRLTRRNVLDIIKDVQFLIDNNIGLIVVKKGMREPVDVYDYWDDLGNLVEGNQNWKYVKKASDAACEGMLTKHQNRTLNWVGPVPLGFDKHIEDDGRDKFGNKKVRTSLVQNEDIEIVKDLFHEFLNTEKSYRKLVKVLENSKTHAKKGKNPSASSVKHILVNPIYCGIWAFGVRHVGKHGSIGSPKKKRKWSINPLEDAASIWEDYCDSAIKKHQYLKAIKKANLIRGTKRGRHPERNHRYGSLFHCANCGLSIVAHDRPIISKGEEKGRTIDYYCSGSQKTNGKCRTVKPYRKHFNESEMDELLRNLFGEMISGDKSFHWNFVCFVADDIKQKSITSGADVEERLAELHIREQELKKVFQKTGRVSDWFIEEQTKINLEISKLEEEMDSGASISTLCKEQYERFILNKEIDSQQYLALAWKYAVKLVKDNFNWDVDKIEKEMGHFVHEFFDGLCDLNDGSEVLVWFDPEKVDEDGNYIIQGRSLSDPDELLALLKTMGFDGAKIHWRQDMVRGRIKNVIDSLEFRWASHNLVGNSHGTLTVSVDITNQNRTFSFTPAP